LPPLGLRPIHPQDIFEQMKGRAFWLCLYAARPKGLEGGRGVPVQGARGAKTRKAFAMWQKPVPAAGRAARAENRGGPAPAP